MNVRILIMIIKIISLIGFLGFAAFTVLYVLMPAKFSPVMEHSAFWYALGLAFMVTVTVLALMIFLDPKRYWVLLVPLAAGKLTSSVTSLYLSQLYPSVQWLKLTVVTDGTIAIIAIILLILSYIYLRG
ncbi:MAG: hypothetical protein ACP5GZ_08580 [Vulcanisaeta sp.]|jgi:hypothetical protein|uniref:hypothetical protein n=1 Tax=Vulcanisaeta sp. TaxID=2020871 RepID=UPI003D0EA8B7